MLLRLVLIMKTRNGSFISYSQLVVDALLSMEIASPDDLKPAITSVAETVGTIMNLMLGGNTGGNWRGLDIGLFAMLLFRTCWEE